MRFKQFSAKLGLLVLGVIILITGGILVYRQQSNMNSASVRPQTEKVQRATTTLPVVSVPGLPVSLKIPKIGVNSSIESLGLTAEGDMDVPKGLVNAGWYNAGHRPGSIGSAVINGHFGAVGNKPAIFDKLHTLQKSDLLYVEDGDGNTHTFVVSEMRTFQPNEDASIVFRSSDEKGHLNLITCQGRWEKSKKSYSARLVVFADLLVDKN